MNGSAHPNNAEDASCGTPSSSASSSTPEASSSVPSDGSSRTGFSETPSLEDIRRLQEEFSDERGWNQYHTPRNLLLALVGEVGELSECFQWKGEVAEGLKDWAPEEKKHLEEEMSDVLIYLVRLADKCHVDLPQAVINKIGLNRKKYPANEVYGSSKKYTEYKTNLVNNGLSNGK